MTLPPGPDSPPAIQVLRWLRAPFELLEECQARYGDAFTLRFPGLPVPMVILSAPEAVKDVFALGPDTGLGGKANFVLKPFLGQHSLLLLDGAEHARQRKMILPAFHGERMQAYGATMLETAHASVDRWPIGDPFPVHRPMQEITLQVILRTVFGVESGPRFAELADVLTRGLAASTWPWLLFRFMQRDLGPLSPWGRWLRLAARARALLLAEIGAARDHGTDGRTDVLAMMLEARDEAGRPLDDDEIHDELVTLLVAGHETTATALAWALRWILPDGALLAKLRGEIAGAAGDAARIARLELLDATVKEALRLQPVVPQVGRVLARTASFAGVEVPAGAFVAPSIYLVHRRAAVYPDPARFRPERFLSFKPSSWEWLPFGGGLRRCVGAAFAAYEMKMVLAAVLPRIDARLASDDVRAARRSITITPAGGLPIVVTTRRSRAAAS
jgi:cytochrome P450